MGKQGQTVRAAGGWDCSVALSRGGGRKGNHAEAMVQAEEGGRGVRDQGLWSPGSEGMEGGEAVGRC